ncbi:hypothetical protein [Ellagibacter isourolithinifaciens]|uniref:hypothetical protein n=1 Tax=Ellagibacter isourolithinifaciens TaxID=2137581 RepID=UPI0023F26B5D|nr:hypothetical protein [Ellagibacter isourolithinifaciens]MDD5925954.1 hypothetical protein [Ellagibacter isourolithinifaciens]MEE0044969.1 hypothetical protein [Ellagibacter isourolithinifaciens]
MATAPASAFEHPKTISHCGHADASTTLNWYAHTMPGNGEHAANLLAAVLEHPEKAAKTA